MKLSGKLGISENQNFTIYTVNMYAVNSMENNRDKYKQIPALLKDLTYRKLVKNPTVWSLWNERPFFSSSSPYFLISSNNHHHMLQGLQYFTDCQKYIKDSSFIIWFHGQKLKNFPANLNHIY
jgi:hypothetical protein